MSQPAPITLRLGDSRTVLAEYPDSHFDSVVTDPPYDLGFMGKEWDKQGVAFAPATWRGVLRVLKPGGYMLAMGGTRTFHRVACAVEDAGFEMRDCLMWLYGSGFPKGTETNLKPAYEPILLARKPGPKVLKLQIDGCRVPTTDKLNLPTDSAIVVGGHGGTGYDRPWKTDPDAVARRRERAAEAIEKANTLGRYPANILHDSSHEVMEGFGENHDAARFFYCAKASKSERGVSNTHPTVKPLALMRWLVRLVTPPGGTVLDPFLGSGTTALACREEGFGCVGIEMTPEYLTIAEGRARPSQAA